MVSGKRSHGGGRKKAGHELIVRMKLLHGQLYRMALDEPLSSSRVLVLKCASLLEDISSFSEPLRSSRDGVLHKPAWFLDGELEEKANDQFPNVDGQQPGPTIFDRLMTSPKLTLPRPDSSLFSQDEAVFGSVSAQWVQLEKEKLQKNRVFSHNATPSWPSQKDIWSHPQHHSLCPETPAPPNWFYRKSTFLWFPETWDHRISGCLPCPFCKSKNSVRMSGFRARRVFDMDRTFFILGRNFICSCQNRNFRSWHPEVVSQLPRDLVEAFPIVLRKGMLITKRVSNFLTSQVSFGCSIRKIRSQLVQMHKEQYQVSMNTYYYQYSNMELVVEDTIAKFGDFDDVKGFNGFVPCENTIKAMFLEESSRRAAYLNRRMQMIDGKILKADCSHKIVKYILFEGHRAFKALYTVFNEYQQVVGSYILCSNSHQELGAALKKIAARFSSHGVSDPVLFYTDNCCQENEMISNVWPSLVENETDGAISSPEELIFPLFTLPDDLPPVYTNVVQVADELCSIMLDDLVIGLDIEWTTRLTEPSIPNPGFRVDTIQLCRLSGQSYVFHVSKMNTFPHSLKSILESEVIKKVGRGIGADIVRISKSFSVNTGNYEDIGSIAFSQGYVSRRNCKLLDLVKVVLKKSLLKHSRLSNWTQTLSESQTVYAALDSWAHLSVYQELVQASVHETFPVQGQQCILLDSSLCVALSKATVLENFPENGRIRVQVLPEDIIADGAVLPDDLNSFLFPRRQVIQVPKVQFDEEAEVSAHGWTGTSIKLDPWHAMNRIMKTIPKKHGLFMYFCSRMRDIFFGIDSKDIENARKRLREKGKTDIEIKLLEETMPCYFLKRCRRVIPPPHILLDRLQELRRLYANVPDASTGKLFFSQDTHIAFDNLFTHVRKGCISDNSEVELYHLKNENTGVLSCYRGSSSLEGYHLHVRLLTDTCKSTELMDAALREFNFRWNIQQGISNRGDPDYGHFLHSKLETLREVSDGWFSMPLFSDIPSTLEFRDTGESFGILGVIDVEDLLANDLSDTESDSFRYICSRSESILADKQRQIIPYMSSVLSSEEDKFMGYILPKCIRNGKIHFDLMAESWNSYINLMLSQQVPLKRIRRTKPDLIQELYVNKSKRLNALNTYRPIRASDVSFRDSILQIEVNSAQLSGAETRATILSAPVDLHEHPESEEMQHLIHDQVFGEHDILLSTMDSEELASPPSVRKRKPAKCRQCGHCKWSGDYSHLHPKIGCMVPEEFWVQFQKYHRNR